MSRDSIFNSKNMFNSNGQINHTFKDGDVLNASELNGILDVIDNQKVSMTEKMQTYTDELKSAADNIKNNSESIAKNNEAINTKLEEYDTSIENVNTKSQNNTEKINELLDIISNSDNNQSNNYEEKLDNILDILTNCLDLYSFPKLIETENPSIERKTLPKYAFTSYNKVLTDDKYKITNLKAEANPYTNGVGVRIMWDDPTDYTSDYSLAAPLRYHIYARRNSPTTGLPATPDYIGVTKGCHVFIDTHASATENNYYWVIPERRVSSQAESKVFQVKGIDDYTGRLRTSSNPLVLGSTDWVSIPFVSAKATKTISQPIVEITKENAIKTVDGEYLPATYLCRRQQSQQTVYPLPGLKSYLDERCVGLCEYNGKKYFHQTSGTYDNGARRYGLRFISQPSAYYIGSAAINTQEWLYPGTNIYSNLGTGIYYFDETTGAAITNKKITISHIVFTADSTGAMSYKPEAGYEKDPRTCALICALDSLGLDLECGSYVYYAFAKASTVSDKNSEESLKNFPWIMDTEDGVGKYVARASYRQFRMLDKEKIKGDIIALTQPSDVRKYIDNGTLKPGDLVFWTYKTVTNGQCGCGGIGEHDVNGTCLHYKGIHHIAIYLGTFNKDNTTISQETNLGNGRRDVFLEYQSDRNEKDVISGYQDHGFTTSNFGIKYIGTYFKDNM